MKNRKMGKELEDLTETEIKALLYDECVKVNRANNNIRILEEEIVKRQNTVKENDK